MTAAAAPAPRTVRLAFSPDADDVFMFWPLLNGRVKIESDRSLSFVHERVETESLNARASGDDPPDVCAVSIAHLSAIADRFQLLPHGGSVGRGYGPVVVAKRGGAVKAIDDLAGKRVAVPGLRTTAYLVLRLLLDHSKKGASFEPIAIPITPFARVFEALDAGEVDAALLIHEGRLTYEDDPTLARVVELGEAWLSMTGLPLPLGGNAIRSDLGPELIRVVSQACRASIAWSLAHRDEVIEALIAAGDRKDAGLSRARLDRYLAMYANDDTADYTAEVLESIHDLLRRGHAAGLLPRPSIAIAP
ncbi:MAG: menaquinone biosynthesis family protein [Polyangiales bacterium]